MVGGAVERDAGGHQPAQRVGEVAARRVEDRGVEEPGMAARRRGAAEALPGVEPDVVVVAAGRDEGGLGAVLLHELEPEHAGVEPDRPVEVGDLQVHVPDPGAGRDGSRHGGLHRLLTGAR